MANDFFELYKHPDWQRKRLAIMERDGFECRECGDKETTLNVHHSYYLKGHKPWEYPDDSLRTLCEKCHEYRTRLDRWVKRSLGHLCDADLMEVSGYAIGVAARSGGRCGGLQPEGLRGLAAALGLDPNRIRDHIQPGTPFTSDDLRRLSDVLPPPESSAVSGRSLCGDCQA